MIHPTSPHITGAGATDRSALVEELTRRIDANRDGDVTSAEFTSFLSALMQSLDDEQAGHHGAPAAPASPSMPASADAVPLTPAQAARALRQAFEPLTRNR